MKFGMALFGISPRHYGEAARVAEENGFGFFAFAGAAGQSTEMIVDSCLATKNLYGLRAIQAGTGAATLRAGQNIVMNNTSANVSTFGGSFMISQGGNRIGGAVGGTTGFTSTVAQQ